MSGRAFGTPSLILYKDTKYFCDMQVFGEFFLSI